MWKIKTIGFFIFFYLSLVFSFAFSSSVSAVSDITGTVSFDSPDLYPVLCTSSTPCSDYKYLIIESDSSVPNTASITFYSHKIPSGSFFTYNLQLRSKYVILDISNFNLSASNFDKLSIDGFSNFSAGSYTYTLTDTSPGSGTSEPCPVCPTIPDNPYDAKFDQVTRAIYTCGAILLVLYFFYCIYRIIIKNGGSR